MRKIILSQKNFLKVLLTTININNLRKLSKKHKSSLEYIPIIFMKNSLLNLFEDDSTSSAFTATIIGKMKYEHTKIKPKNDFQKRDSKIDTKKSSKVTSKNNQKTGISQVNSEASVRISGQKKLISEVITITPYISQKKKIIIGASTKNNQDKKQAIQVQKKENTPKASSTKINPTIKKQHDNKRNKSKIVGSSISAKPKPQVIANSKTATKPSSSQPLKSNQSKTPKYKLQKKKSSSLVALFSVTAASLLLALTFGHKKAFSSVLALSSVAILSYGMFANNKNKTIKTNKQLVKKI